MCLYDTLFSISSRFCSLALTTIIVWPTRIFFATKDIPCMISPHPFPSACWHLPLIGLSERKCSGELSRGSAPSLPHHIVQNDACQSSIAVAGLKAASSLLEGPSPQWIILEAQLPSQCRTFSTGVCLKALRAASHWSLQTKRLSLSKNNRRLITLNPGLSSLYCNTSLLSVAQGCCFIGNHT